MNDLMDVENTVHLGHNLQRIREIMGMKQSTLAINTGMTQQNISRLEQNAKIADETLEILASGLGVSTSFIKRFNEEKAIYNIQNNYDNASQNQHGSTINNTTQELDKAFFEKMLADKDEQIKFLREELAASRVQLSALIEKLSEQKKL